MAGFNTYCTSVEVTANRCQPIDSQCVDTDGFTALAELSAVWIVEFSRWNEVREPFTDISAKDRRPNTSRGESLQFWNSGMECGSNLAALCD